MQRYYEMEKHIFFKNRCCIQVGTREGRSCPTIRGICGRNSWITILCVLLNIRMGRNHFQHVVILFIIRLYAFFARINHSLLSYEESVFLVLVMMRGFERISSVGRLHVCWKWNYSCLVLAVNSYFFIMMNNKSIVFSTWK